MSDLVVVALIAAVAPTIASLSGVIISLSNKKKTNEVSEKVDLISDQAEKIHTLTNSNLSAVTSALTVANARIEEMQKLITSLAKNGIKIDNHK